MTEKELLKLLLEKHFWFQDMEEGSARSLQWNYSDASDGLAIEDAELNADLTAYIYANRLNVGL